MKSIFDPSFRYVTSANTDVRATFARVRLEQQSMAGRAAQDASTPRGNVVSLVRKAAARQG